MHSPGSVHLEPVPSPASVSGSTPRRAEISRACAMWENKQVERARQDAAEEGGGQAQGEDPSEGGANEAQPKMTKEPNPMGQRTQPKRPKVQRDGLPRTWSGPSSRRQGRVSYFSSGCDPAEGGANIAQPKEPKRWCCSHMERSSKGPKRWHCRVDWTGMRVCLWL